MNAAPNPSMLERPSRLERLYARYQAACQKAARQFETGNLAAYEQTLKHVCNLAFLIEREQA